MCLPLLSQDEKGLIEVVGATPKALLSPTGHEPSALSEVVERSLLSLLFIPLLALVFLLVWKVRLILTLGTVFC